MVAKNGEKDNYARAGLRKLSLNKYLKNTVQNAFLLKIPLVSGVNGRRLTTMSASPKAAWNVSIP